MTTTANTKKQDDFFKSLYTPESIEYHTLTMAKNEIYDTVGYTGLQWEIKKMGDGGHILKFITTEDFWSGVRLMDIGAICQRMNLVWWIADCYAFNGHVMDKAKVSLNVAVLGTTKS